MEATNIAIREVHISTLKAGDTVNHNGLVQTLCSKDIGQCSLFGASIFGDSYKGGNVKVKKVLFRVQTNNGLVFR